MHDSHLVVLSSDNHLRYYDLDVDRATPEQSIALAKSGSSSFFANTSLSVKASLGETAVCFAFAPPVPPGGHDSSTGGGNDSEYNQLAGSLWPIFVLQGNGEIHCVVAGLGPTADEHKTFGPLTMLPENSNNYGADSCALLCLHPLISSPPILVIATNGGILYHCVVLNSKEESDCHSQVGGARGS